MANRGAISTLSLIDLDSLVCQNHRARSGVLRLDIPDAYSYFAAHIGRETDWQCSAYSQTINVNGGTGGYGIGRPIRYGGPFINGNWIRPISQT